MFRKVMSNDFEPLQVKGQKLEQLFERPKWPKETKTAKERYWRMANRKRKGKKWKKSEKSKRGRERKTFGLI